MLLKVEKKGKTKKNKKIDKFFAVCRILSIHLTL